MRFIFLDIPIDDALLATRAVKWLLERDYKDAILAYGSGTEERHFLRQAQQKQHYRSPLARL